MAQAHENDLEAAVADYQSQLEEDDAAQLEAEEEADEGQSEKADTTEAGPQRKPQRHLSRRWTKTTWAQLPHHLQSVRSRHLVRSVRRLPVSLC